MSNNYTIKHLRSSQTTKRSEHEYEANNQDLDSNIGAERLQQQSIILHNKSLGINPPRETEIGVETQAAAEEGLRRSKRTCMLTKKGMSCLEAFRRNLTATYCPD